MSQIEVLEIFKKDPNKRFTVKEVMVILPGMNKKLLYRTLSKLLHWNLIVRTGERGKFDHVQKYSFFLNKEGERKWKRQDI